MGNLSLRDQLITGRTKEGQREAVMGAFKERKYGYLEPAAKQKNSYRYISHEFEVKTPAMQNAFESYFPRFSSTYVYVLSQLKTESSKMDEYLVFLLEASIDVVKTEHAELLETLEGERAVVDYPKSRKGHAEIYGKPTRLFLDLILATDKYIQTMEACLILGYTTEEQFLEFVREWKYFIKRTKKRFESVVRKIGLTAKRLEKDWQGYLVQQMKSIDENQSSLQSKKPRSAKANNSDGESKPSTSSSNDDQELFQ